jgi:hypothetical protein
VTSAAAPGHAGAPAPGISQGTGQNHVLKQCPGRSDPPVHRRGRCTPASADRHDLAAWPPQSRLPVDPVKDIGGHQVTEADAPLLQEPCQAHDVKRVGPRDGVCECFAVAFGWLLSMCCNLVFRASWGL